MNRHQRRQAEQAERQKTGATIPSESFFPDDAVAAPAPLTKPSLLVRAFAAVVLSAWVLRRVRHPAARAALALVAREVGRNDLAAELER